jgi:hypothetical protein
VLQLQQNYKDHLFHSEIGTIIHHKREKQQLEQIRMNSSLFKQSKNSVPLLRCGSKFFKL